MDTKTKIKVTGSLDHLNNLSITAEGGEGSELYDMYFALEEFLVKRRAELGIQYGESYEEYTERMRKKAPTASDEAQMFLRAEASYLDCGP